MDGWGSGLLGVIIFSGSLPATRIAVADFSPMFLTSARAVIAALLGAALLFALRQPRPSRGDLASLVIIALGVVVGFPLLTALALQYITSAHSIGGERPKPLFWLFSGIGSATVVGFALNSGAEISLVGDLLMVAAVIVCGLGYAEGAKLSRTLGGWQVISWALVLSLPAMGLIMLFSLPGTLEGVEGRAWAGLAYVSIFSMLIGFIFWYRGLALGGIAAVGQLQLLQPFFGLLLAAGLLHEKVSPLMIVTTLAIVLCVAGARKFAR
jgi:drug/metabolite transporter (DMT)-like permease